MNVLIDNSTYYSFKTAIQSYLLDANIVYNIANFLECLVVADKVLLAPTTLWYPDPSDGDLFATDGPCAPLRTIADNEQTVTNIFQKAIDESIKDLSRKVVRNLLPFAQEDIKQTSVLLRSWKTQVDNNPLAFMEIYSGLVYFTDVGTSEFFTKTFGNQTKSIPSYHHLANFLLRTNVAMEMSERLVYHPHSHRVPLVCKKMSLKTHESASLVSALIRQAEAIIKKKISDIASQAILSCYGGFTDDSDLPLVFAVVLSGARTPDDIIPLTLELRDTLPAKRYRKWITKLISAVRKGTLEDRINAERELGQAKQVLTDELVRLYDVRRKADISHISKLTSVTDPELISTSLKEVLAKTGIKLVKSAPELFKWINKIQMRRKVTLLINLAKRRLQIDKLNSLLERTFHKKLSLEQMSILNNIRMNNGKLMAELIRGK